MRLNRYLAICGVASRRKAEEILSEGRVRVNGKIVLLPSISVTVGETRVELDDRQILPQNYIYIVMNKPAGYVCAVTDKYDPVILELVPESLRDKRVFPVGRLDRESEGMLLLTNDGEFAYEITHPSSGLTKEYEVLLDTTISDKALARWKKGCEIEGRFVAPVLVERMDGTNSRWVRVVIKEGLKREVRQMARLAGYKVEALIRRKIGQMRLSTLLTGKIKEMTLCELREMIRHGGDV